MNLIYLALALKIVSATIINEGKFFYTSMRSGTKASETNINEPLAMHVVDTLVSDGNQQLALGLNTNFSAIALMDLNCAGCEVTHRYDPAKGNTSSYISGVSLNQQANIFQSQPGSENMINTRLTSQAMHEYMKL